MPTPLDDYTEATPEQRIEALQTMFARPSDGKSDAIHFEFMKLRSEVQPPIARNATKRLDRFYYIVTLTRYKNNKKQTVDFKYDCPHEVKLSTYDNPRTARPLHFTTKGRESARTYNLLLNFLYCLSSDYDLLEHQGIKDGFDLMDELGYGDPKQARDTFNALRTEYDKVKSFFTSSETDAIAKIVEGF